MHLSFPRKGVVLSSLNVDKLDRVVWVRLERLRKALNIRLGSLFVFWVLKVCEQQVESSSMNEHFSLLRKPPPVTASPTAQHCWECVLSGFWTGVTLESLLLTLMPPLLQELERGQTLWAGRGLSWDAAVLTGHEPSCLGHAILVLPKYFQEQKI